MRAGPALPCGDGREKKNEDASAGIRGDLKGGWTMVEAVGVDRKEGEG